MNIMMLLPDWRPVFLHCAVVGVLAQSISCSVFSIGADLYDTVWILFMFVPYMFLPSANSSKRKEKATKMVLFFSLYKTCKLNVSLKSRNLI